MTGMDNIGFYIEILPLVQYVFINAEYNLMNIEDLSPKEVEKFIELQRLINEARDQRKPAEDHDSEEDKILNGNFSKPLARGFYGDDHKDHNLPNYDTFGCYMRDIHNLKMNDAFSYIYKDNFYQPITNAGFNYLVDKYTLSKVKPTHYRSFFLKAQAKCFTDHKDIVHPTGYINLKNGVLNVKKGVIKPHDPKHFFRYKLDHDFNPDATCHNWIKFLSQTFKGDQELIDICAQLFGYILVGGHPWAHLAFCLYGDGRNGKSTFLEILTAFLGKHNTSSVSLANLDKPFSAVQMDGKLANIVFETPSSGIDSPSFKLAIGGEYLTAAHKGRDEYDLEITSRFVFACNKLPNIKDATVGAYEKFQFIPFKEYIYKKDRDRTLSGALKTEMSGILNWALTGLKQLESNKGIFPDTAAHDEVMDQYRRESDSVYEWYYDQVSLVIGQGQHYPTKKLFLEYEVYATQNRRLPVSFHSFSKRLKTIIRQNCDSLNLEISYVVSHTVAGNGYDNMILKANDGFLKANKRSLQ